MNKSRNIIIKVIIVMLALLIIGFIAIKAETLIKEKTDGKINLIINKNGKPDYRDQPQGIEQGAARLVIGLHPGASLSCLFGMGRQWFLRAHLLPGQGRAVPPADRCAAR